MIRFDSKRPGVLVGILLVGVLAFAQTGWARKAGFHNFSERYGKPGRPGPDRVFEVEGDFVHNVGALQMTVANFGGFGSAPGSTFPSAHAPSAQWPAGSGNEYLFIGGLWVGALLAGVPAVTTAAYEIEFAPGTSEAPNLPPADPILTIYRSFEGAPGGARLPSPAADDDQDGSEDEDFLDGLDNDGDGRIDEDYAAVGNQMFSCVYIDYDEQRQQLLTEHRPLNIEVHQRSFQWEETDFDDFVGIEYQIKNVGIDPLEEIYLAFFADSDAGNRDAEEYWLDDCTDFIKTDRCVNLGGRQVPVHMEIGYAYDCDGDEGKVDGYFGVMFLGHSVDPTGESAPPRVGIATYRAFSGDAPFENGGDPDNDFQRYELLSSERIGRPGAAPKDYRMVVVSGKFLELQPESTLTFQVGFVIGHGLDGMLRNAANAQLTFNGNWFDVDNDAETGVNGRETQICGPVEQPFAVDSCVVEDGQDLEIISFLPRGQCVYINDDCRQERDAYARCGARSPGATLQDYQTGVEGKETQIHWLVGSAPPPPNMRLWTDDNKVHIFWDNFSETVPDISTLKFDFESYRVWRADGWDRPVGTTLANGPPSSLWMMLKEFDQIQTNPNDSPVGDETGLDHIRYQPLGRYIDVPGKGPTWVGDLTPVEREDLISSIEQQLLEFPDRDPVPAPGFTIAQVETAVAVARWNLGMKDGKQYYLYTDDRVHSGAHYFYAVSATDHQLIFNPGLNMDIVTGPGKAGSPASNFDFINPVSKAQAEEIYNPDQIIVVPNPVSRESLEPWRLNPSKDDPTGIKVEFRNLPKARSTIRIFTLAGDLVETIDHDGGAGNGTATWNLVSRNGQDVTSGVYLFTVDAEEGEFESFTGKFVVIR
jgi:hypothetical protein